jgi:hypothetical protein
MHRTRPRHARGSSGRRRLVAVGSALVLTAGAAAAGVAAAAPASADTTVTSGSLAWGYKQSFRAYVGNQTGAIPPGPAPVGERVVVAAPAAFDPASPAVATTAAEAQRPYTLPVSSGEVTPTAADVSTTGGVTYNFPSHGFEFRISNVRVTVSGGDATVRADTYLNATIAFGNLTPGEYTGSQVVIATGTGAISVGGGGESATVTATGLTLASAAASYTPQAVADAMDDLSLTVALTDEATASAPAITAQPADASTTVGGTATFTAAASGNPTPTVQWQLNVGGNWQNYPGATTPTWTLTAHALGYDGAKVRAVFTNSEGSATTDAATLTVTEEPTDPGPGEGEQLIRATVPEAAGGEFTWTIDSQDVVDLGTLTNTGTYYHATGAINTVTVNDTRTNQANAWSVSGVLADFTGGLSGSHVGWTPKVVTAGAGATAGDAVNNSPDGGPGLATAQTLGSAADGHSVGSGTLGADLDLKVPNTTPAGEILATLTLTALS